MYYFNNREPIPPSSVENVELRKVYEPQYESFQTKSDDGIRNNPHHFFGLTYFLIIFKDLKSSVMDEIKKEKIRNLKKIGEQFFDEIFEFVNKEQKEQQQNQHRDSFHPEKRIKKEEEESSSSTIQKPPPPINTNTHDEVEPSSSSSQPLFRKVIRKSTKKRKRSSTKNFSKEEEEFEPPTKKRKLHPSSSSSSSQQQQSKKETTMNHSVPTKRKVDLGKFVRFRMIKNDSKVHHLELLCTVKNVYSLMLPNMPRYYMSRLIFEKSHLSLIGQLNREVVCGITFRPFPEQGFIEIAFVAVHQKHQVRGIGTRMMSFLKDWCQRNGYFRMLTCADNLAIGYFAKQGFSPDITLVKKRYSGYIKSYDDVTLMECVIRPGIPYLGVREMVNTQKSFVEDQLKKKERSLQRFSGLDFKKNEIRSISQIPGIKEAGWEPPNMDLSTITKLLLKITSYMQTLPQSWPFREKVNKRFVTDDHDNIIKQPMDLTTLAKKIKKGEFQKENIHKFHEEMKLIFEKGRIYNQKGTAYYQCADACEQKYLDFIKRKNINLYFYF